MLFNSFIFLFGFLPLALILTYATKRFGRLPRIVLTLLSLGFYAWWKPPQLIILVGSIIFNYLVGGLIQKAYTEERSRMVRIWLVFGILCDLALLGWFKYANFVVANANALGADIHLAHIALPLAISFFTFQKLAYLVDSARGEAKRMSFLDFSLFASFFPQLIAGPITHYKEMVPQFQTRRFNKVVSRDLMVGLVIFAIGLFKKTVIADTLALYANPLFGTAMHGAQFNLATGWLAAITFTFQLYFDFSGYSDMAIGLGRMFGVKLPLNFHSPLRASNIIDYWRRWHMTLQRFIVAYLFQPLSLPLNWFVATRGVSAWPAFVIATALPSFVTFVAVGVWHGAGWTFVLFGVMHAIFICVNQYWRERRNHRRRALRKLKQTLADPGPLETLFYHALTLTGLAFSNVLFRSTDVGGAITVWRGMIGLDGGASIARDLAQISPGLMATLALSTFIVFLMPNTQQIMGRFNPAFNWDEWRHTAPSLIRWTWKPSTAGLIFAGITLFAGVMFVQRGQAVFLYFNF